jgi:hypothetical protein
MPTVLLLPGETAYSHRFVVSLGFRSTVSGRRMSLGVLGPKQLGWSAAAGTC